MRSAELRLKEETAVARLEGHKEGLKEGRAEERKKCVKIMYKLYKTFKPEATIEEAIPWIQKSAYFSLSYDKIRYILKEDK